MHHFGFTKLVVEDLDGTGAFYAEVFGLTELYRVRAEIAGREIDEILYAPTAEGGATFAVLRFADGVSAPEGVITGFVTDEIEAVFARAVAAGGRVAQAPADMAEHRHRVGFLADPEGRLVEVVQALG